MKTLLTLLLPLLLMAGCASHPTRIRGEAPCDLPDPVMDSSGNRIWESTEGKCGNQWAVRRPTHGVNYVEIDEQGILHDRQAAEDALKYAAQQPSAQNKSVYVVVYIHGWQHNASPDDGNVQHFHGSLAAIKKWRPTADVRGIYIGWRGSSLPVPILQYLTFWDRKNTSDEVGRGGLLEFLLRLERGVKPDPKSGNHLVLVAHSFGASVAFNSLAHVFMARFIEGLHSSETSERFRGYGDLVLLINPAIEAMRYMPLQSAIEYYANRTDEPRLTFEHEKKPRLVILSSEGDWATRKTFPVARFFSTALEAHNRTISELKSPDDEGSFREWNMDVSTVGNYDRFQTHWPLRIAKARDDAPNEASAKVKKLDSNGIQECHSLALAEMQKRMSNQAEKEPSLEDEFGQFPDSNIRVVRRPNTINNSPYIVADVGAEIVADHSKIDSENLICWINQIVDAD
jgi:hypothetical protein